MKIQISRAQDGEHYIVWIDVGDGVSLERTIDEEDYRLLKEQIKILDEGAELSKSRVAERLMKGKRAQKMVS